MKLIEILAHVGLWYLILSNTYVIGQLLNVSTQIPIFFLCIPFVLMVAFAFIVSRLIHIKLR